MSANLENLAVATRLKKVSFHPSLKEGQCEFKLLYICAQFTCLQGNAQNPSSYASTIHELITSRGPNWT